MTAHPSTSPLIITNDNQPIEFFMSVTLFKGNDRYSTISSKLSFPAFIMRMAIFLRYSSCPSRRCCFNSIINVMYSNLVSSCCFTRSTFEATSLMKLLSAVLPLDLSVVARMLLRFFMLHWLDDTRPD